MKDIIKTYILIEVNLPQTFRCHVQHWTALTTRDIPDFDGFVQGSSEDIFIIYREDSTKDTFKIETLKDGKKQHMPF